MGKALFGGQLLDFGGAKDLFVSRLNASGEFAWTTTAGGDHDQVGVDIARDGSGNLIVAGDFEGDSSWGSITLSAQGESDCFVAMLDPTGKWLRVTPMGGPDWSWVAAVAADGQGNSCVTGSMSTAGPSRSPIAWRG